MEDKKTEIETEIKIVNNKNILPNQLSIPLAIIAAGIIIAGAIIYTSRTPSTVSLQKQEQKNQEEMLENLNEVSSNDHVRGNPNADVVIVEYSDTECPFCKRFHETMKQVMSEYGDSGKVAWVYRHFPIDQLHSKARPQAVAMECAAKLGGNDAFWKYADRIYQITPSNNGLDMNELPKIASYVGLDVTKFNECLVSGEFDGKIEEQVSEAVATGAQGTPWSIIIGKDGKKYSVPGALPYEAIKQMIEKAL